MDGGAAMPGIPASFDRTFKLWRYSVSHGELLLRSTKQDDGPAGHRTRVDVFFKDVRYLELPTIGIRTLRVERATRAERDAIVSRSPAILSDRDMRDHDVYALRGKGWAGFVVAGYFGAHEDEGEYFDPSHFDPE